MSCVSIAIPDAAAEKRATAGYALPFLVFVIFLALESQLHWPAQWIYPLRFLVVLACLLVFSRPYLTFRAVRPVASVLVGAGVFAVWVGPDILFHYRHFWLFENRLFGSASSTVPEWLHGNLVFIIFRSMGCTLLVPVVEELFWRGYLMRWLETHHFLRLPIGTYCRFSFWAVALLFATEHGSYWEVGLAAGVIYNWWIVRTRCLADCILAHAVTNGLLSAYVLISGQWQYWL